ncbi:hypothetical protein [Bosea sp. ANAM02]|nr:hypothetical protein [Bosea sp. ANAM02]
MAIVIELKAFAPFSIGSVLEMPSAIVPQAMVVMPGGVSRFPRAW